MVDTCILQENSSHQAKKQYLNISLVSEELILYDIIDASWDWSSFWGTEIKHSFYWSFNNHYTNKLNNWTLFFIHHSAEGWQ